MEGFIGVPGSTKISPAERLSLGGIEFQPLDIEIAVVFNEILTSGDKPIEIQVDGGVIFDGATLVSSEHEVISISPP